MSSSRCLVEGFKAAAAAATTGHQGLVCLSVWATCSLPPPQWGLPTSHATGTQCAS